eukprot:2325294-Heterocapsa_arctica.AAC.1
MASGGNHTAKPLAVRCRARSHMRSVTTSPRTKEPARPAGVRWCEVMRTNHGAAEVRATAAQ